MTRTLHIVNVSGGKDSAACYQLALEMGLSFRAVAADTGHEHPITYAFLEALGEKTGGPPVELIQADFTDRIASKRRFIAEKWPEKGVPSPRIARALEILRPTGNAYLDLCLWKGRFPSIAAQFCTGELKTTPIYEQILRPALQTQRVIQWLGVRRAESKKRAKAPMFQRIRSPERFDQLLFRPLIHWSAENVFSYAKLRGTPVNPLYRQGMKRVGCFPCIHASKDELRAIAIRYPEAFERVKEMEELVADASRRGAATFFSSDTTPEGRAAARRGEKGGVGGFHYPDALQVAEWSKTGRGGRNYDIIRSIEAIDEAAGCSSEYGLCE